MRKKELKGALIREKKKYVNQSFEELSNIYSPITYECGAGDNWYQVEVQLLEKNENYVHVSISIDDGKLLRTMFPISTSFIVYKDGRVEE